MRRDIIFSTHALESMAKRRISQHQVRRALLEPDVIRESRGRLVAEKETVAGNILRVVYIEHAKGPQVISTIVITVIRMSRRRNK